MSQPIDRGGWRSTARPQEYGGDTVLRVGSVQRLGGYIGTMTRGEWDTGHGIREMRCPPGVVVEGPGTVALWGVDGCDTVLKMSG